MVAVLDFIDLCKSSLPDLLDDLVLSDLPLALFLMMRGNFDEGVPELLDLVIVVPEQALEYLVAGHAVGFFIKREIVMVPARETLVFVESLLQGWEHGHSLVIACQPAALVKTHRILLTLFIRQRIFL
jgi:hypothetical protein